MVLEFYWSYLMGFTTISIMIRYHPADLLPSKALSQLAMALILDGNSEYVAHVRFVNALQSIKLQCCSLVTI